MKFSLLAIVLAIAVIGNDAASSKVQTTKRDSLLKKEVRSSAGTCVPRILFTKTASYGGPGGYDFDDAKVLRHDETIRAIHLRSAARIDRISFETQYNTYHHGGHGGYPSSLHLASSEKITSVYICYGHHHSVRVFYLSFRTSHGRHFSGGRTTSSCRTISIPSDKVVVGGFGRSGSEVDRLGFVLRSPLCH